MDFHLEDGAADTLVQPWLDVHGNATVQEGFSGMTWTAPVVGSFAPLAVGLSLCQDRKATVEWSVSDGCGNTETISGTASCRCARVCSGRCTGGNGNGNDTILLGVLPVRCACADTWLLLRGSGALLKGTLS